MRLTKKDQTAKYGYKYVAPDRFDNFGEGCHKLGQFEDIEEEYCVTDFKDLRRRLDLADKYGELSEQLGVDLIVLFKALLVGIYYKGAYGTNNYKKIVYQVHPTILFEISNELYCFKPTFFDFVYLKDYGKTWALTEEELL